jgi:hypothetical protein
MHPGLYNSLQAVAGTKEAKPFDDTSSTNPPKKSLKVIFSDFLGVFLTTFQIKGFWREWG